MDTKWFQDYFDLYKASLYQSSTYDQLLELKNDLINVNHNGKKTMILGNGGSAVIASHVSVGLSKNAKIRTINFNEADLITCNAAKTAKSMNIKVVTFTGFDINNPLKKKGI